MINLSKVLIYVVSVGYIFILSSLGMHGYSKYPILCIAAITLALISSIYLTSKKTKEEIKKEIKKYLTISITICLILFISDFNVIYVYYNNSAPTKFCLSNQRKLQAAIDLYNTDNTEMICTFNKSALSKLVKGGYLEKEISCPGDPAGEYLGKDLDEKGIIRCSRHGSVLKPIVDPQEAHRLRARKRENRISAMIKYTVIVCFFMVFYSILLRKARLYNKEIKKTFEDTENDE